MHLVRSAVAVSLVSSAAAVPAHEWVVDLAKLVLNDDPWPLVEDLIKDALGQAFTHKRSIRVAVHTPHALQDFKWWFSNPYDGVDFAWEHTADGLAVTFHNDGPISGCVAFMQPMCPYSLFIAASNPLIGGNKVRVGYLPHAGPHCNKLWDDMDSWGEKEGEAHLVSYGNYDNPSTVAYSLEVPDRCRRVSEYYEHVWLGETDFHGGDEYLESRPFTNSNDAWHHCKGLKWCTGFTVAHNTGTVWYKNVFASSHPTHNSHATSYVMAQTNYYGVSKWWKIFEGVRLTNHIHSQDSSNDRDALTRQCEEMSGCDAFCCTSWTCWFYDFSRDVGFMGPSELGYITYIAEKNPWADAAMLTSANVTVV